MYWWPRLAWSLSCHSQHMRKTEDYLATTTCHSPLPKPQSESSAVQNHPSVPLCCCHVEIFCSPELVSPLWSGHTPVHWHLPPFWLHSLLPLSFSFLYSPASLLILRTVLPSSYPGAFVLAFLHLYYSSIQYRSTVSPLFQVHLSYHLLEILSWPSKSPMHFFFFATHSAISFIGLRFLGVCPKRPSVTHTCIHNPDPHISGESNCGVANEHKSLWPVSGPQ